jgi:hypothetical protein
MMRVIALLLSLAVGLAGCGQKQAEQEEKAAKKPVGQEEKVVKNQADQEEKAVSAILKLGGYVRRDEKLPGQPVAVIDFSFNGTKIIDAGRKELKQALPKTQIFGP